VRVGIGVGVVLQGQRHVFVAHQLGDRLNVHAVPDQAGAEAMPQVIPADGPHLRRLQPGAEGMGDVVMVEGAADLIRKDQRRVYPPFAQL